MKKITCILLAFPLLWGLGCKKFLDEDLTGKVVGDAVLSTQDGLEAALTGAYKGLGYTWTYGFFHGTATAVTMGGDDITTHPGSNKQEFREFDQFNVSADNSRSSQLYQGCYKTIQGANNVIENYENTVGDEQVIHAIAGEAYFLRAFAYYWLVRLYGKIPLITSPKFSLDLLTISATDAPDIYSLIESDLKEAIDLLPDQKRDYGRPNKGTALAFLADVYLTEGGWPIKDASKYGLAAATAKQVIDDHEKYGFAFPATYAEVFENDPSQNGTAADVFDITANKGNGTASDANYGSAAMPEDIGGWSDFFSELDFFYDFPAGPRKDVTFRTTFKKADGTVLDWKATTTKHPYYGKFWIKGDVITSSSSLPLVMMRYAHVLLIYAEAKARESGPDADAYTYLNKVRQRGGEGPIPQGSLSAAAFADSVVQERAWEFAGERSRWFDLVRLEMVEAVNMHKNPGDLQPKGTITKDQYTIPLPFSETSANPNLK